MFKDTTTVLPLPPGPPRPRPRMATAALGLAAVVTTAALTASFTAASLTVADDEAVQAPAASAGPAAGAADAIALVVRPVVRSAAVGAATAVSADYTSATAEAASRKPRITVVGTGGTIAGVARSRSSFLDYRSGVIPVKTLVRQLEPELSTVADVNTVQFGNKGSDAYSIAEFRALTVAVERALKDSDGVVVTSGTDTMEEFAYWLDLTVQSRKPVVVTGAMRPWAAGSPNGPQVLGADGPANLFNAVTLAASSSTYCFGTVLMLNDEFHAARDVTKTSTLRADTFQTRELGVLGWIDGPNIKVGRAPARVALCDRARTWQTPFDMSKLTDAQLPRVEVVTSYQQAGGEAISAFAAAGVRGIVTAGTGAGGISAAQSAARTAAAASGVVFVSTSRTGSGSVYDNTGNVIPPDVAGNVVAGDDLLPQKARLLLLLSLAFAPDDVDQVRTWVTTLGNLEWQTGGRRTAAGS